MPRLNGHKRNSSDSRFDRRSTDGWSKEGRAVRILTQCHFKSEEYQLEQKSPGSFLIRGFRLKKGAASYSPALHCSTIGAGGLNFSVRNGKRWDPAAITT